MGRAHHLRIALCGAACLLATATAQAGDPALQPGRDPSGTAVAVLADGFDYTRADIASILARDGEGEAIAWDAVDDDPRPFAHDGLGTETARIAAARGGVRIVPVRVATSDPATLARAVAFTEATPARIVLVHFTDGEREGRRVLAAAAQRFAQTLFVGAAPDLTQEERTLGETIPNLLLIDARAGAHAAAERIAKALGCGQSAPTATSGAELKQVVLGRAQDDALPAACQPEQAPEPGER